MKRLYKITIILCAFGATFFFTSCEDFLSEQHPTKITAENANTTEEGLLGKIYALYSKKRSLYEDHGDQNARMAEFITSTELCMGAGFNVGDYGKYVTPSEYRSRRWALDYLIIDRVNDMVDNGDIPNKLKQAELLAEARLFRADAYFELFRIWDNIPLKTEATTLDNIESYVYEPADKVELFNYMHADIDSAVQNLPFTMATGRYNKAVALHLKMKLYMWQADVDDTRPSTMTADDCLDSVFLYAQKLILENSGGFKLKTTLDEVFTVDDLNHEEMLFVIQFDSKLGQISSSDPDNFGGTFHRIPLLFTTKYKDSPMNQTVVSEYGGYGWARVIGNTYFRSLFKASDLRLTHYYKSDYYYNNAENVPPGKNIGDLIEASDYPSNNPDEMQRFIGMGCKKYWDNEKDPTTTKSHRDIVIYRLAESYLIGAEAAMKKGDMGSAKYLFNAVHTRAGLPPVSTVDMDLIRDERARELGFEGQRWFFLKRIGQLHSQVSQFSGEATYDNNSRTDMEPYMVTRAIPIEILNAMGDYPQTEGYN